jgi:hypothetical protein
MSSAETLTSMNDNDLHFDIAQYDQTLTVSFDAPVEPNAFHVDGNQVGQAAEDVRRTLTAMCEEYLERKPGQRSWDKPDGGLLRDLAQEGVTMKRVFFGNNHKCRDLLNGRYNRVPITFRLKPDVKIHAPWGLMFDLPQDPANPKKEAKIEDLSKGQLREGFWCASRDLAVVYQDSDAQLDEPLASHPEPSTRLLAVFNPGPHDYVDKNRKVRWEHEFSQKRDLMRHLADNLDQQWILYFFCHAQENTLILQGRSATGPDTLVPLQLMNVVDGSSYRKSGIVFLNGCKTGVSNRGYSWQQATRHRGLAGYIGTESIVPTKFAWDFGRDFLYLLASGKSPREAMRELRARHFPLSLVYGLYCLPDWVAADVPLTNSLPKPAEGDYCSLPADVSKQGYDRLPFRESNQQVPSAATRKMR